MGRAGKGEAHAEDRHLEAGGAEEAFGFAKEAGPREPTLFDVVRRKYDELTHRWALLPGKLR